MTIEIVSMNPGYGWVKAKRSGSDRVARFPSVFGPKEDISYQEDEIKKQYPNQQLTDEAGEWFMGELAREHIHPSKLLNMRGRSGNSDSYGNATRVRLFKAAMAVLFEGEIDKGDVIQIYLVTGLPMDDHKNGAAALKASFLTGEPHHVQTERNDFYVQVVDCKCVPEPVAGFYLVQLNPDGSANKKFNFKRMGVVDGGTQTIDITEIAYHAERAKDPIEVVSAGSGSVGAGLTVAYESASKWYNNQFGEKPTLMQLEGLLKSGSVRVAGKNHDVPKMVQQWLEPTRQATVSLVASKWNGATRMDVIPLIGGAAEIIKVAVAGAGYDQIWMPDDPQMAICEGWFRYGMLTFKRAKT